LAETVTIHLEGHIPADKISLEVMQATDESSVRFESGVYKTVSLSAPARLKSGSMVVRNGGIHTELTLMIPYTCGNTLSQVNVNTHRMNNGKLYVYVSALEADLGDDAIRCQAMPFELVTVTVPGVFLKDSVEIVNL